MDYRQMETAGSEQWNSSYRPEVLDWGPTDETLRYDHQALRPPPPPGDTGVPVFRRALERRFSCIGESFWVAVNGTALRDYSIDFELRIPESGEQVDDLKSRCIPPGGGSRSLRRHCLLRNSRALAF